MSQDRTAAVRVARMRKRRKADGLVEIRAWVEPEQAEAIRAYLDGQQAALTPAAPAPAAVPPAPAPAQIKPTGLAIVFDERPKFELRERLKKAGWTYDPNMGEQGTWTIPTSRYVPDDRLFAAVTAAGGKTFTARI